MVGKEEGKSDDGLLRVGSGGKRRKNKRVGKVESW